MERIQNKAIKLAPLSSSLSHSGFDTMQARSGLPREVFWIVLEYLDFSGIVNAISAGLIPWTDFCKSKTSGKSPLIPVFSLNSFPVGQWIETINEDGDIDDSFTAQLDENNALVFNPFFVKFTVAMLVHGDPLYCKFCKQSVAKESIQVYWVWMVRCCDQCVSKFTICEYDLMEKSIPFLTEIRNHLPSIRKPFTNWGSMAYDFYWAPDVVWVIQKRGEFKFKTREHLNNWYEMTDKYKRWARVEKVNQENIVHHLKLFRGVDSLQLDYVRKCHTFITEYSTRLELFKPRDFTPEFGQKLSDEYDEAMGVMTVVLP